MKLIIPGDSIFVSYIPATPWYQSYHIAPFQAFPPQPGTELLAETEEYSHARSVTEHERCVGTMSRSEWEACSLYVAVGFKKARPAR